MTHASVPDVRQMLESTLMKVLPGSADLASAPAVVHEFVLQAWALLACVGALGCERYDSEWGNLRDLADTLAEYVEAVPMGKCYDILETVQHIQVGRIHQTAVTLALRCIESNAYIEIYYRKGILLNQLHMYLDLGRHGAFGISRGSDIIQVVHLLLQGRKHVRALDLGSGNGFSTMVLSHLVAQVTGVELYAGLYQESLLCLRELDALHRVDRNKIRFVHADFLAVDFSSYALFYIYWPYDDDEKDAWEQDIRARLQMKLIQEAQPGALIVAMIPGADGKDLFPKFERLPLNTGPLLSTVEVYRVGTS